MTEPKRTYRLQDSMPTYDEDSTGGELQTHRKSILVVEDEEDLNHALSCCLRKSGFHVTSSFDALSGLQQTGYHKPDLVLIDLIRPDLQTSGYLGEFLELDRMKVVPIILLVPETTPELALEAERLGVTALLQKPIAHPDVARRIGEILKVPLTDIDE
ncbi:MAG: DNA-binding response OmpR family regulator [Planctomycetota bacterium]|jgi:DNA-binding response OmpR family regulator